MSFLDNGRNMGKVDKTFYEWYSRSFNFGYRLQNKSHDTRRLNHRIRGNRARTRDGDSAPELTKTLILLD